MIRKDGVPVPVSMDEAIKKAAQNLSCNSIVTVRKEFGGAGRI